MSRSSSPARLAGLAGALLALFACGSGGEQATGDESDPRSYRVRGIVRSLPAPETGAGDLRIQHEAIPDLVGPSGEIEGMAAMTMPFPLADDLDLTGLAAGDAVEFDLRVDWEASRPVLVTAIEKLREGTELALD